MSGGLSLFSTRKWRPSNLFPVALVFVMALASVSPAPFSSWAGKRSSSPPASQLSRRPDLAQIMHDLQELYLSSELAHDEDPVGEDYFLPTAKRAPFSSWAGKRAPFSSWAGKRAAFSSWAGKRAPFSSWAGKRSGEVNGAPLRDQTDMDSFGAVEGRRFKRSSGEETDDGNNDDHSRQRRGANAFSAWGGKRAELQRFTRDVHNDAMVPVRVMRPHRAAFSAWGG